MLSSSDEDRLLLIPGPTPVAREILDALATPTISHNSKQFAAMFLSVLDQLRSVLGTEAGKVFVFSGSGTLAQETAIINFVEPSDVLLVASNGFFGDRLSEIATAHGLKVASRQSTWGESLTPDEVGQAIQETGATVVAFTHVETSTGAMAQLPQLCETIRAHGALSIVDGVAAFGGVPEPMDEIGIDVLLCGTQKALGVPPGLGIVAAGQNAWSKRAGREAPMTAFYADLSRWLPVMEQPDRYFSTHSINLVYALHKGLELIAREGLPQRYRRHKEMAERFRAGMLSMGFELFTAVEFLAPTLSALKTPPGVRSSDFRERLRLNGVVAAAGLNDVDDRVIRFGHMGNIADAEIAVALDAVKRTLSGYGAH
ncbi:MAG TPA: alanine--glyoxylate aminotransferase family protein [Chloroflexota bacterium]|jgi:aspartate aminotransferase-like enzyme|nr:alanine--glyoxylate aminotransferase family protein [Chloroflexota bacterium]